MRAAVVGGGLAGLSAALELVDAGHEVTLYEARPTLGGAVQTLPRREGDPEPPPDNGQHIALGCFTEYLRFLARIGESGSVRRQPLELTVIDEHGRTAEIKRSGPALLRYRHISLGERVRVVKALVRWSTSTRAQTFGAELRARGQSERAVERFWDVFIRPALNLRADEASAEAGRLHRQDRAPGLEGGLRPRPADPPARRDARRSRAPGARGRGRDHRDRHSRHQPRHPRRGRDRRGRPAGRVRAAARRADPELEDSPIVSVHLLFDRRLLRQPLAALLGSPAHWLFDRGLLTGHEPEQGQYLTVVSSGAPELEALRGRELVDLIAGSVTERLGPAELLWSRVSREPAATIAVRPGTEARRRGPHTGRANVTRAGAWTATGWPPTMEGAVEAVAQPPARWQAHGRRWPRDARNPGDRDAHRLGDRRRDRPAARAAAPRRLVGRRARVERDDDRAAPLLAPRPRPAYARARPQDRERAPGAAARRRHLVDLVRRPARPVDLGRGVRRPEARGRRPGPEGARLHPLPRAGSREHGSSRSASSRSSASGRGSGSRRSRSGSSCFRPERRSRSTTSPAGRGAPSSRSPPAARFGPFAARTSTCARSARGPGRGRRPRGSRA